MLASHPCQANDRILVHSQQATGLPDPTILLKVVQHGHRLVLGQFAAIEGAALAFAEALLARPASQDTGGFTGSIAEADAQVVQAAASVVGALGVLAAESFQVVPSSLPCSEEGKSCLAAGVTL
jgi:hypothetical protein